MAKPTVTIIGPGAIGGALAAAIVSGGGEPILVARTPFDRLRVEWPDGSINVAADCRTGVGDLTPSDVVIVATKATHNPSILPHLEACLGPESRLVIAQNGVDHLERFDPSIVGDAEVIPAVVFLPAERPGPGHVVVGKAGRLVVPSSLGAGVVASLFAGTFVQIDQTDDWITAAWRKLVMNAPSGAISLLARRGPEIYADNAARELLRALMDEVMIVAAAEGARLEPDLPEKYGRYFEANAGGHTTSIVLDRLAGVATEWRERNAAVGRIAARHGIDVPLNNALTTLIRLGEPDFRAIDG